MIETSIIYSYKDLADFKTLIQDKIISAKEDLKRLRDSITQGAGNGTNDTYTAFKAFEEGSETLSKESNSILAQRQEKFIRDLNNALIRIENKTYGICRVTGKLINKERLKLVPHATLSIEAKMQKNNKRIIKRISKKKNSKYLRKIRIIHL